MSENHLPVRPDAGELAREAQELLLALQRSDPAAGARMQRLHPHAPAARDVQLEDAQLVLARSYGLPSWTRLTLACRMTDAIWTDDLDALRELVTLHPELLHEDARGVKGNWGPPMSYAANLGRERIVELLHERGARDVQFAFDRACLQGRLETARRLQAFGARPQAGCVMGPCESLNAAGLEFVLDLGAPLADEHGDRFAPVAMILETYARAPQGKHRCLELCAAHGIELSDTPAMALHRGRLDLLARHLERDPGLFTRTFSHAEIYPRSLGCHADESLALHGTPLDGATLLHLCVDFDELEIARWLLENGMRADESARVDADGFGGHTALFGCVVSQPARVGLRTDDAFARLLLEHGADVNARASLRKRLRFVDDETLHEYRDVTPLSWGARFHAREWVSEPVLRLIAERSGRA